MSTPKKSIQITSAMIDEIINQKTIDPSSIRLPLESFERLAEKIAFLSEAAKILNSSPEIKRTLGELNTLIVPGLADWCLISLKNEDGTITAVAATHSDKEKEKLIRSSAELMNPSLAQDIGAPMIIRTGKIEFDSEVDLEELERMTNVRSGIINTDVLRVAKALDYDSYMGLPLITQEREILGAIQLGRSSKNKPKFNEHDLSVAADLAASIGQAVKNSTRLKYALNETHRLQIEREIREDFFIRQMHNVRTPLTVLSLIIEMMSLVPNDPEKLRSLAQKAKENIIRARDALSLFPYGREKALSSSNAA